MNEPNHMNSLLSYIFVAKGVIPKNLCDEIVEKYKKIDKWKTHSWTYYDKKSEGYVARSEKEEELMVMFPESDEHNGYDMNDPAVIELEKVTNFVFEEYMKFHIQKTKNMFFTPKNRNPIRFNRYITNSRMRPHVDHIHSLFDGERKGVPILSLVGHLNDDYSGGDFHIVNLEGEPVKLEKGDVIVFPSSFLYPHEVKLVTSGERWTFVSWAF